MREDRIDRHGGQIDSDIRIKNAMKMYYKIVLLNVYYEIRGYVENAVKNIIYR